MLYRGTFIIQTPLGPHQTVLIIEVSLVQRLVHNTAVGGHSQIFNVKVIVYKNVYTIIIGYHISSSYIIGYNTLCMN